MNKNIFIGVAWPYVNGNLHIGHLAGYLLPADICARFHKIIGNNVLMVSGSDCHGTPITIEADKRKVSPKDIVEEYHNKDYDLFMNTLGLSYSIYTKTDHPNHIQVTQDIFLKLLEKDLILIQTAQQFYSPTENRFLPDRYVIGKCPFCGFDDSRSDQCDNCGKLIGQTELISPKSNLTKQPVELKDTEHYFVDWPKLQAKIKVYVEKSGNHWKNWVLQETLGWLNEGLQPRAITRDIDWGVPIPVDRIPANKQIKDPENKRFYVWFDAVIGYLSASILWSHEGNGNWRDFWFGEDLKHYYFMGKDNLPFHTMFWPGKLMEYDQNLHLPDVVSINMFLNYEGRQFSKSRGVSIDIKDIVEKYGNDRVRFYLTYIMPELRDSSFSWQDFKEKVNGILVANIGNFIHRTLSLAKDVDFVALSDVKIPSETVFKVTDAFNKSHNHLNSCHFRNYLDEAIALSSYGNGIVDREKLWALKSSDPERFNNVVKELLFVIIGLGYLLQPLLPNASARLFDMLSLSQPKIWPLGDTDVLTQQISQLTKKIETYPLFEKIEEASL